MTGAKEGAFIREMTKMVPVMLREMSKRNESSLNKMNLPVSNIIVLDVLREKGPSAMGDIARSLGLTMSAATGIVDKMIKNGVVKRERSDTDRRVVKVALLKKGQDICEKVQKMRKDIISDMYSVLSDQERDEYLTILRKVYSNMIQEKA